MSFNKIDESTNLYNSLVCGNNESSKALEKQTEFNGKKSNNSVVPNGIKSDVVGDYVDCSAINSNCSTTNVKSAQNNYDKNDKNKQELLDQDGNAITQELVNKKEAAIKNLINCQPAVIKDAIIKNFNFNVYKHYKSRSLEEQYEFLLIIEGILNELNELSNNATIDENKFAEFYIKNIRNIFNNSELINEAVPENNAKDVKNCTRHKTRCLLGLSRRHSIKKINNEKSLDAKVDKVLIEKDNVIAEIEEQRAAALERCKSNPKKCRLINQYFDELKEYKLAQLQMYSIACAEDNAGKLASEFFRGGKQQAKAEALTIDLEKTPEGKAAIADMHTQEFHVNKLKIFYEQGDAISSEVYGEMVAYTMQYKTAEAAEQYEQDAYEYRRKVECGEIDAPWMSKEHLTSESVAIGVGIHNNTNMSQEQKANLLTKWDSHAQQFSDYKSVKQKYGEMVASDENKLTTEYAALNYKSDLHSSLTENLSKPEREQPVKVKPTVKQLSQALSDKSIQEVKTKFPSTTDMDIAAAVLHDSKLKKHWNTIIDYLNKLPEENLAALMKGCSTESYCFVLRHIIPSKAGKIYDLSSKNMCYAARTLGENILEETDVAA